jgi:hypothetical protein
MANKTTGICTTVDHLGQTYTKNSLPASADKVNKLLQENHTVSCVFQLSRDHAWDFPAHMLPLEVAEFPIVDSFRIILRTMH